ncbi:alpha-1,4-N-acetylglucosaminyltransferase [Xenopus laevis]|uniref:Alpha 1,4-glycosyltransferase domain-containing protein n=2 Tax=Xenopus laevis TaxID=8355 RepID=A0A974CSW8_XENLA|nr:alpha-1,4-N-acetylglucosaminyltransferase [Xenopus laevis]OCT78907.1 hypothetical protein XELAEV_18029996mg [Xenopus laevis]
MLYFTTTSKGVRYVALFLLIIAFGFLYRTTNIDHSVQLCILNVKAQSCEYMDNIKNNTDRPENINTVNTNPVAILRKGNGIIFVETTDRMKPPSLVLCAIESAARVYRDRPVVFFMKGLADINLVNDEPEGRKIFPTLSYLDNVYFLPLKMDEVFRDTPLLPWYIKISPKKEQHWIHVSSDGCRLALIWKHGGIYMDTDIISLRPIPNANFLAAQSSQFSSNGIFGLSPHHNFSWRSMDNFVQNYNGTKWGHQGPQLFTRVLNQECMIPPFKSTEDVVCGNISFLNPQRFYPIPYPSWRRYYEAWQEFPTFNDSYALHLWNYMNQEQKSIIPGSKTLIDQLYKQYCPSTYEALQRNESIHL